MRGDFPTLHLPHHVCAEDALPKARRAPDADYRTAVLGDADGHDGRRVLYGLHGLVVRTLSTYDMG